MNINTDDVLPLRKQLGELIRKERERQGLNAFALSKTSETSTTQIKAMEEGRSAYTVDALLRVLAALDCSLVMLNADWEPSEVIRLLDQA